MTAQTADGPMKLFVARPDGDGPFPIVFMLMDATGYRDGLKEMCRRYVEDAGVLMALPDMYHRLGDDVKFEGRVVFAPGNEHLRAEMFAAIKGLTDDQILTDVRGLLDALAYDPAASDGPIGGVGYCLGGRGVIRAMAAFGDKMAAGSAIHPSHMVTDGPDSAHLDLPKIKGELYLGCGGADDLTSPETIAAMTEQLDAAGVNYMLDVTEGANHGFALDNPARYHAEADRLHWERTTDLFKRRLPG